MGMAGKLINTSTGFTIPNKKGIVVSNAGKSSAVWRPGHARNRRFMARSGKGMNTDLCVPKNGLISTGREYSFKLYKYPADSIFLHVF